MLVFFISLLFLHPGNILFNSSFETWILNQPVPWLTSQILNPGSALPDSDAYSGEIAIKLDASLADTAFATQMTGVYAESTYHFKGWAKTSSAIGCAFIITWFKSLTEPVGTPIVVPITYSTNYHEYTQDCVAHDSAQFVNVGIFALFGAILLADSVTLDGAGWGVEENAKCKTQNAKLEICGNKVYYSLPRELDISLSLYDISGRLVKLLEKGRKDEGNYVISLPSLRTGIYFISLNAEQGRLTKKFIIFH